MHKSARVIPASGGSSVPAAESPPGLERGKSAAAAAVAAAAAATATAARSPENPFSDQVRISFKWEKEGGRRGPSGGRTRSQIDQDDVKRAAMRRESFSDIDGDGERDTLSDSGEDEEDDKETDAIGDVVPNSSKKNVGSIQAVRASRRVSIIGRQRKINRVASTIDFLHQGLNVFEIEAFMSHNWTPDMLSPEAIRNALFPTTEEGRKALLERLNESTDRKHQSAFLCPSRRVLEDSDIMRTERQTLLAQRAKLTAEFDAATLLGVAQDDDNVISNVAPGSQAEAAGVEVGWKVVSINGADASEHASFIKELVNVLRAGRGQDTIPFELTFETHDPAPPPLMADVVRRHINGYDNQQAMMRVAGGDSWCSQVKRGDAGLSKSNVGYPNIFVSWALSSTVVGLVTVLRKYMKDRNLDPAKQFFWICDFCIRQNDAKADVARLGEMVQNVGNTVMYLDSWDRSKTLKRAWVVFELFHTADCGGDFDIVMDEYERTRFISALEARGGYAAVQKAFAEIDIRDATSYKLKEKQMIMDEIAKMDGGATTVNRVLFERLTRWVLTTAREEVERRGDLTSSLAFSVAILLKNQGELEGSRLLWDAMIPACAARFGETDPKTMGARGGQATVMELQGDLNGAQHAYKAVLEVQMKKLGIDDPQTLATQACLANVMMMMGDFRNAKTAYLDVIVGFDARLAEKPDPNVSERALKARFNLATILVELGDLEEARKLYEKVVEGRCAQLGKNHVDTLHAIGNLADLLAEQGQAGRAVDLYEVAIEGRKARLGPEDEVTKLFEERLEKLKRKLRNTSEWELRVRGSGRPPARTVSF